MKKRVAGAVILVAIGVGIWLSNLFKGIGPGGEGTEVALSPDTLASVDTSQGNGAGGANADTSNADATQVVPTVLIDEREFFLESPAEDGASERQLIPMDVTEIAALARNAAPNADGIRIQVKRRRSSRPSAETALAEALHAAGLSDEQILHHTGFVD